MLSVATLPRYLDKIAQWSIYLLIFTLPFSKSIVEITIVTALLGVIIKKIITREEILRGGLDAADICLILFIGAALLSLFNTQYMSLSLRAFFSKSVKFAALFFVVREAIDTDTKLKDLSTVAFLSCAIILVDGFIQYFITHVDVLHNYPAFKYEAAHPFNQTFPTASFPFPNDFAAWILVLVFPMGAYSVFAKDDPLKKISAGLLFIGLVYFLVLTKVRGALVGFVASLATLPFFRVKKMLIIFVLALLVGSILINRSIVSDMISFSSMKDRSQMWKTGWDIFQKHPIIGNGVNTFFVEYRDMRTDNDRSLRGSYAHNCYLQMAAEVGAVGLAAFLGFAVCLMVKASIYLNTVKDSLRYPIALGLSLGLTAFLIHSLVDTNLYSLNLAALFWVSAGLLSSVTKAAGR